MLHTYYYFDMLDPDQQAAVAGAIFDLMRAGEPRAPFLVSVEAEAREWTRHAVEPELLAYLFAIWPALSRNKRAQFIIWAQRREMREAAAA